MRPSRHHDNDAVKEGAHRVIVFPIRPSLVGTPTNPEDSVDVMWTDTPYAHIMVTIGDAP